MCETEVQRMDTGEEEKARGSGCWKKVLITGVTKGLGRALALEMGSYGHTIIGCSRNQAKLDSLRLHLSKLSPTTNHLLLNIDLIQPQC